MSGVHLTIGGANACGFGSRVNAAMAALRTFHSAANYVEWYAWAPIVAQQTEFVVIWSVMWQSDPSLPNMPIITWSGATRWVQSVPSVRRSLLHPAITDPHHSCLVLSDTITDFTEG